MFSSKSGRTGKFLRQLQLGGRQLADQCTDPEPLPQKYLASGCHRTYSCIHCRAHLADHDELVSKLFQGNHGRAYLFNKVVNVGCKPAVERELLTGLHAVSDIYCDCCETTLGWKYEQAFVASQKYKEGKFIIELVHMLKENNWDLTSYNTQLLSTTADKGGRSILSDKREIVVRPYRLNMTSSLTADPLAIEPENRVRLSSSPQDPCGREVTLTTRQSIEINQESNLNSAASLSVQ